MLAALLLAGLVAAPVSSAALFVPVRSRRRVAGTWPATRRLALALLGTVLLAAVVAAFLTALHATRTNVVAAVAGVVAMSLLWLPATRRWNARAHLCWAGSLFLFVSYLAFTLQWTLTSGLGAFGTTGGLVLWLLELLAVSLQGSLLVRHGAPEVADAFCASRLDRPGGIFGTLPSSLDLGAIVERHRPQI
jgi:hypothetical protein